MHWIINDDMNQKSEKLQSDSHVTKATSPASKTNGHVPREEGEFPVAESWGWILIALYFVIGKKIIVQQWGPVSIVAAFSL